MTPAARHSMDAIAAVAAALCLAACSLSITDPLQQSQAFAAKGDIASAVVVLRSAVQEQPSALTMRLALGDALERSGDLTGAEQHYRRALELGGSADVLVPKIALILMDRNDLVALQRDFEDTTLSQAPANSDLRGILACVHLMLGEKAKALDQLMWVTVETPAVRLARAQWALGEGREADAADQLEHLLKEPDPPWWVLRAAARFYWAKGNSEQALAAMKSAYAKAGAHPEVMGEYAEKLLRAGHVGAARQLFAQLQEFAPSHYRTFTLDALLQADAGNFDAAYLAATRVLAAMPEHIPMLLLAAKVELDRAQLLSAEARLEKILAQNPQMLEALRLRYQLELLQGKAGPARSTLHKALQIAPQDRWLLAAAADHAWSAGDRSLALRQLSMAAQQQPIEPPLLARLAEMMYATGNTEAAIRAIDLAIELSATQPKSREAVLRSTMRMRLLDRAKTMVQADMAQRPNDPEPHMWMAGVLGKEGHRQAALEQIGLALDARADYYPALFALAKMIDSPAREKMYDERMQNAISAGSKDARVNMDRIRRL